MPFERSPVLLYSSQSHIIYRFYKVYLPMYPVANSSDSKLLCSKHCHVNSFFYTRERIFTASSQYCSLKKGPSEAKHLLIFLVLLKSPSTFSIKRKLWLLVFWGLCTFRLKNDFKGHLWLKPLYQNHFYTITKNSQTPCFFFALSLYSLRSNLFLLL